MRDIDAVREVHTVDQIDIGSKLIKKAGVYNSGFDVVEQIILSFLVLDELCDPGTDDLDITVETVDGLPVVYHEHVSYVLCKIRRF